MQNVSYSFKKFQGEPAVVLSVEGENKGRIFQFDKPYSADTALELLATFNNLLEEEGDVSFYCDDSAIVLTANAESFYFEFHENDIGSAIQLVETYNELISDNDDDDTDNTAE